MTDCPLIQDFIVTTDMNVVNPIQYNLIMNGCCEAAWISCLGNDIHMLTLIEFLNTGNISALVLPDTIKSVTLVNLNLYGTIPTIPDGTTLFKVPGNMITGSIPTLPSTLQHFDCANNLLDGSIPVLPIGLRAFFAAGNQLTGSIPSFPGSLEIFDVSSNLLNDDMAISSSAIRRIYLSGNAISGNVSLSMPIEVYLNNTLIDDIQIDDISELDSCDISNASIDYQLPRIQGYPCILFATGSATTAVSMETSAVSSSIWTSIDESTTSTNVDTILSSYHNTISTWVASSDDITVYSSSENFRFSTVTTEINTDRTQNEVTDFTSLVFNTSSPMTTSNNALANSVSSIVDNINTSSLITSQTSTLLRFDGVGITTIWTISLLSIARLLLSSAFVLIVLRYNYKRYKGTLHKKVVHHKSMSSFNLYPSSSMNPI